MLTWGFGSEIWVLTWGAHSESGFDSESSVVALIGALALYKCVDLGFGSDLGVDLDGWGVNSESVSEERPFFVKSQKKKYQYYD